MTRRAFLILVSLASAFAATPVSAQSPTPVPVGAIYVVQSGDTLWDIAALFDTSVEAILAANHRAVADIYVGDRLLIPGLQDLSGVLTIVTVSFGETLRSLGRQYRMDDALMKRLNHLVSPTEVYAGYRLIVLQPEGQTGWQARTNLAPGETLLELAVQNDTDTWTLAATNALAGTWAGLPGDVLYLPSGSAEARTTGMPAAFAAVEVNPLPPIQGATVAIRVTAAQPVNLGGLLIDHPLHFFQLDDGDWLALQGVHALTEPGIYPLRLEATLPDGEIQSFEQMVLVKSAYYSIELPLVVSRATIDPAVTEPEYAQIAGLVAPATPQRYWNGGFASPGYFPDCYNSLYGNRRTYRTEDSSLSIEGFHSGVDLCGGEGLPIYAPAPGVVVFAGPLEVRGNATVIDHGWGVYSGFWHQSEIFVQVGQMVATGDIIGRVGGTGRVTGPHLHWEIWVNGVLVDPLDWLETSFP